MTPKPNNLPAPADMTLQQLLCEVARILHNMGGPERGAEYSAALASEALRRAENLPGWRHISSMPEDADEVLMNSPDHGRAVWPSSTSWTHVTHWYDFGGGAPMPPAPETGAGE